MRCGGKGLLTVRRLCSGLTAVGRLTVRRLCSGLTVILSLLSAVWGLICVFGLDLGSARRAEGRAVLHLGSAISTKHKFYLAFLNLYYNT